MAFDPTPIDGYPSPSSEEQHKTEEQILKLLLTAPAPLTLHRSTHLNWLVKLLFQGFPSKYVVQDASQPWLMYWIMQSFQVMGAALDPTNKQRAIDTILSYQHPDGGFGGGPGQFPHLLATYSAVSALAIVGRPGPGGGWDQIDREGIYKFFMSIKQPDGSFIVSANGEVDIRGTYCLLVTATLLDILTPELVRGTASFIASMQTYEGGFASASQPYFTAGNESLLDYPRPPLGEAHGGYTSCAVASWAMLLPLASTQPSNRPVDLKSLARWMAMMQGSEIEGGGFRGRTNKLVDGCYSWWVGGSFTIVESLLGIGGEEHHNDHNEESAEGQEEAEDEEDWTDVDDSLFNKKALQEYILIAAQTPSGGLRDKPSKPSDTYHTLYNLAGLSAAQHRVYSSPSLKSTLLAQWKPSESLSLGSSETEEERNLRRREIWASSLAWKEDEGASRYLGGKNNRLNATHPLFNLTLSISKSIMQHFYGQSES